MAYIETNVLVTNIFEKESTLIIKIVRTEFNFFVCVEVLQEAIFFK